jgi:hypothetical protein
MRDDCAALNIECMGDRFVVCILAANIPILETARKLEFAFQRQFNCLQPDGYNVAKGQPKPQHFVWRKKGGK